MPQKPLFKNKKPAGVTKKKSANRHGKTPKTRKGKFVKPPKRESLKAQYQEDRDVTKAINARNETSLAGAANNGEGRFKVIKPPPAQEGGTAKKGKNTKPAAKAEP